MDYANAGYVYAITNKVNGHRYIGSTANYKSRWHTHRSALRRGVHHSFILQKAWDKYGEPSFLFEVLLVCPKNLQILYETRLMSLETYNVLRTPKEIQIRGGWEHTAATKAKIAKANKGKKRTPEHRANIAAAVVGRKYNASFCEKARQRQLGVSPSMATREKIKQANLGRTVSPETRAKLSAAAAKRSLHTSAAMLSLVAELHAKVSQGRTVRSVISEVGMSSATYYKYAKLLTSGEPQ
jgi:group I intron endonuclease